MMNTVTTVDEINEEEQYTFWEVVEYFFAQTNRIFEYLSAIFGF